MSWLTSIFKKSQPDAQTAKYSATNNNQPNVQVQKIDNSWGTQAQQGWGTQPQQGWGTQAISQQQGWGTQAQQQGWGSQSQQTQQQQGWGMQAQQQGWGTQAQTHTQQYSKSSIQLVTSLNAISPYSEYAILSALNMDQALTIEQGTNKTILWKDEGSNNQKFRLIPQADKYKIQIMSGGMLEVPNGATSAGIQLFVGQPMNAHYQLWSIVPVQGIANEFVIKSFCGKCLDVCEQKSENGTKVIHYNTKKKNNKNQAWYIRKVNSPVPEYNLKWST